MFLFVNYDASRVRQGVFRTGVTPTALQLQGNFSAGTKIINDPLSGAPFPGNIIPPAIESDFSGPGEVFPAR